jgi:predicted methyltransferase
MFDFYDDARLAELAQWADEWSAEASSWGDGQGAGVSAFYFGDMQQELHGTVDAVLFIRALHNMARFSAEGDFLDSAIDNAFQALKPGGIVGIVQHAARANMPATWANGASGYLHETFVIEQMQAAGFEFVGRSDINTNPLDVPGADEVVWRLPPVLSGSKDNAERVAIMSAIGESNRMTLKFRKPAA